jgi:hypothetical protein
MIINHDILIYLLKTEPLCIQLEISNLIIGFTHARQHAQINRTRRQEHIYREWWGARFNQHRRRKPVEDHQPTAQEKKFLQSRK